MSIKPGWQWWEEGLFGEDSMWQFLPGEIGKSTERIVSPVVSESKKILWPVAVGAVAVAAIVFRSEIKKVLK